MRLHIVTLQRWALILCSLIGGAACEIVVEGGQTRTLGPETSVVGSSGDPRTAPRSAVEVRPDGTVVVQGAVLTGGELLVQQANQPRLDFVGAGIFTSSGTVRVESGTVTGGSTVVQVATGRFDAPGFGIRAIDSTVAITGGTIRGGSFVSQIMPAAIGFPSPGIAINGGTLLVTGGTILPGGFEPVMPGLDPGFSVSALNAEIGISGGNLTGGLSTLDSRARIFGGSFGSLQFASTDASGCSELRGGQITELGGTVTGLEVIGGRVIVAGSGLSLTPLPMGGGRFALRGRLQSGQPIDVWVLLDAGGVVQLVASGAAGCPAAFAGAFALDGDPTFFQLPRAPGRSLLE